MTFKKDVELWAKKHKIIWSPPKHKDSNSGCFCVECLYETKRDFFLKHKGLCEECNYIKFILPKELWNEFRQHYQSRY